jgi:hypothetical protein
VPESGEHPAHRLSEQGGPRERDQVADAARVREAGEGQGGEGGFEQRLPHPPAPRTRESIPGGHDGEHARLVGDAAVHVAGPGPRRRGAVDQHESRRGAGRHQSLRRRVSDLALHLLVGLLDG